ncbi:acylneuraminate cytidylyltransferase family protein, partial [Pseudomonadales bacterium]|nr:acylneuraminate cytidylyltransferase family protein [Pseudomonadales bacterium]
PLIAHSIKVAKDEGSISEVFVSTDCPEIAAIAKQFGATVIDRPSELASDTASEWLAWQHGVQQVEQTHGKFDTFISLPATSPLRSVEDVRSCLAALDTETDMVITVTPATRSPWFNMVKLDAKGMCQLVNDAGQFHRRQDAPEVFDMTTVAYVARPAHILANTGVFSGRVRAVIIPKERAVDIDDLYDFIVAEALIKSE